MVEEKGLGAASADKIGEYVRLSGVRELVDNLLDDDKLKKSKAAVDGLKALKIFFDYAELLNVTNRVRFDMSLARGLDYYTGIIYEAVLVGRFKFSRRYK